MFMVDGRDPGAEHRDCVGPLPHLGASVSRVDEIRDESARMRRQADLAFLLAPPGETPPCNGVGLARPFGAEDSTALAVRLATAAGISGSIAGVTSPPTPSEAFAAGVGAGRESLSAG